MRHLFTAIALIALIGTSVAASAADRRTYGARDVARCKGTTPKARTVGAHTRPTSSTRCTTCERDASGRIKRDPGARRAFRATHPCPSTGKTIGACPGYIVDHIVPLKRGGADAPANMQWLAVAEAKAKDKIE